MDPKFAGKPIVAPHLSRTDIDRMPDTPNRGAHHRRAQSETTFRFPDDLLLDDVVLDFNLDAFDIPSLPSDNETNPTAGDVPMAIDSAGGGDKSKPRPIGPSIHIRSLSVGADFFEGMDLGGDPERLGGKPLAGVQQHEHSHRHRQSNSMDGLMSSFEAESSLMLTDGVKKTTGPDRLAELALLDPKRAKRILANRQSAARSKERKVRYTSELERKVQTLQTEATTLSAQVTMLQRDTTGLTAENKELKLRLQAMEQQAHLRDALNEALRGELQRLKIATNQIPVANGNLLNGGLPPQFSSNSQISQHSSNNQTQHPQQLTSTSQLTANNQMLGTRPHANFKDFNQRG